MVLQPLLGQDWRELAGFYRIPDKEVRQPRDASPSTMSAVQRVPDYKPCTGMETD